MKKDRIQVWRFVQVVLFLLFFAGTVVVNLNCEEDENPAASPECGSGKVTWDSKSQVCRDLVDNKIIPNKCCGR